MYMARPLGMFWHAIEKKTISPWEGQEWQIDGDRSVQFSSVTQSCPALCDPMDCSTPGFPIHHQLPELAQTHVHWVSDAIQPSHPLLSSSPPDFNLSQHESFPMSRLFTSGGKKKNKKQVARVLELHLQHQPFQWIFTGWFSLGLTGLILQSKGPSSVFSNTTVRKHQLFHAQPPLWSNSHICTWLLEKPHVWLDRPLLEKWCLCFIMHCLDFIKELLTCNTVKSKPSN